LAISRPVAGKGKSHFTEIEAGRPVQGAVAAIARAQGGKVDPVLLAYDAQREIAQQHRRDRVLDQPVGGATPPIPELDIKASAEASGGFAGIVRITGPAQKPKLELSSDPEAPQDEVVARIMFDRTSSGISPFQGRRLATAIRSSRAAAMS
jgi:hypothetical protein